jgi:hypothetical protein
VQAPKSIPNMTNKRNSLTSSFSLSAVQFIVVVDRQNIIPINICPSTRLQDGEEETKKKV